MKTSDITLHAFCHIAACSRESGVSLIHLRCAVKELLIEHLEPLLARGLIERRGGPRAVFSATEAGHAALRAACATVDALPVTLASQAAPALV